MSNTESRIDRLVVVGGGRMGEAIVAGVLAAGFASADCVTVAEPVADKREDLESAHGVATVADASEAVTTADVIVVAVKPQILDAVVEDFGASIDPQRMPLIISIAAGVATSRLESLLPQEARVVRVMPNTPAMVGEGVSAISPGSRATEEDVTITEALFAALGKVVVVDEDAQDAVTAVSGSGPAYVAMFIAALAKGGVANGLEPAVAHALALQTVAGTAALLERTGMSPEELVEGVSSPGGTTVAARAVLDSGGFSDCVSDAVEAAARRSKELGE